MTYVDYPIDPSPEQLDELRQYLNVAAVVEEIVRIGMEQCGEVQPEQQPVFNDHSER